MSQKTHVRKSSERMLCGMPVFMRLNYNNAIVAPSEAPEGERPTCLQCLKKFEAAEAAKVQTVDQRAAEQPARI